MRPPPIFSQNTLALSLTTLGILGVLTPTFLPTPAWSNTIASSSGEKICKPHIQQTDGQPGTPLCPLYTPPTSPTSNTSVPVANAGNPINLLTGNKHEHQLDIDALGDNYALRLSRYYNAQSVQKGLFGVGWRSDYEMQLSDTDDEIVVISADGTRYRFTKNHQNLESTNHLHIITYTHPDPSLGYITRTNANKNVGQDTIFWQWHFPDDKRIDFTSHKQALTTNKQGRPQYGQLSAVWQNPTVSDAAFWQIRYNVQGQLFQVTNHLGEKLTFAYDLTTQNLPKITATKTKTSPNTKKEVVTDTYQYFLDKNNNLSQVVGDKGERIGYLYQDDNDKHNLTAKLRYDTNHQKKIVSSWQYDKADRVIATGYDDNQKRLTVAYNTEANTTTLTNEHNQTSTYHYQNGQNGTRLLSAVGASCETCTQNNVAYTYDDQGRVKTQTQFTDDNNERIAFVITNDYDDLNRVIKRTHNQNGVSTSTYYEYHQDSNLPTTVWQTTANGKQGVKYEYNALGQVTTHTQFEENSTGETKSSTYLTEYDNDGQPKALYALNDNQKELIASYQWAGIGVLSVLDEPTKQQRTQFFHNEQDLIDKIIRTQPNNNNNDKNTLTTLVFELTYNKQGQAQTLAYTKDNQLLTKITYHYDELGNFVKATDDNGQAVHTDSQANHHTDTSPNVFGHQPSSSNLSGDLSNLPMTTQTLKFATLGQKMAEYGIDSQGLMTHRTHPITGTDRYQYDQMGNLTDIILSDGRHIAYTYQSNDAAPQLISKVVRDESNQILDNIQYRYDNHHRLTTQSDDNQTISYVYNTQGQVTTKTLTIHGITKPLITQFGYDDKGQMNKITLPDGLVLSVGNNGKGNNIAYTQNNQKGTLYQKLTNSKQANNKQTDNNASYQLGNHIIKTNQYNPQGEWVGTRYANKTQNNKNTAPLFAQAWQKGKQDIIETITEQSGDGTANHSTITKHAYLYDDKGQLLSATSHNTSNAKSSTTTQYYHYDGNQNRTITQSKYSIGLGASTHYEYDKDGKLTGFNTNQNQHQNPTTKSALIHYDKVGKPLNYPTDWGMARLSYHNGRLHQVHNEQGALIAQYWYNENGQRIKKASYLKQTDDSQTNSTKTDGVHQYQSVPTITHYVYEDSLLQHELDEWGNITRHYVYVRDENNVDKPEQLIATIDYQTTDNQTTNNQTTNKAGKTTNKTPIIHYVLSDHLGRPRQVLDSDNRLVWELNATTFGGTPNTTLTKQTGYTMNLRFLGQYYDEETGLYYNHHRYYDPKTGRYLTPDPLGLAGGENLYTYVGNSPIHYNDPVGLLLFAFDGTGNKDYFDDTAAFMKNFNKTNVQKFRDLYERHPDEPHFPNTEWRYATINNKTLNRPIIELVKQKEQFDSKMQENNVFYISGAGTRDKYTHIDGDNLKLDDVGDLGHGLSIVKRVDAMVGYLYSYLTEVHKYRHEEKGKKQIEEKGAININLDIVGFSRGAASARMFADKVQNIMSNGLWYGYAQTLGGDPNTKNPAHHEWIYTKDFLAKCKINFNFNFMGLYDTVPAYGLAQNNDMSDLRGFKMDIDVTNSDFKTIVHAVAANENRYQFSRRSIYTSEKDAKNKNDVVQSDGKYRLEKGFLGAHSDIGGGYKDGDLSNASLMWMIKQAQEKGNIKLKDYSQYNKIENPIVHDSVWDIPFVYTMGGQFRWANDNSKGFEKTSIFNNFEHLGLNWNDTKVFQNPNHKQFDKVEDITKLYLKSPDAKHSFYPTMLVNPWTYAQHYRYVKLKDGGIFGSLADMVKGADNVLIANKESEMIRLNDYLTWLNCNYGLSLDTNISPKTDKSLPNPYPDMDICTNLGIKYSK